MKAILIFLSVLFHVAIYAATAVGSYDKFEVYHSKSLAGTPLKLDDMSYDDLTSHHRNFTVAVLLTALEARFGCQLCRDFQPEWDLIAKSWVKGDRQGESRVLYGTLDFIDGKAAFQKVT